MDPISVIVTAITLGASMGLTPTVEAAIKDAYAGFRALVISKFGKHGDTADAVEKAEKNPNAEGRKITLKDELTAAGAHKDQEVVDKATELLKLLEGKSPGATGGLVGQINAAGGKVLVIGTQYGNNYL